MLGFPERSIAQTCSLRTCLALRLLGMQGIAALIRTSELNNRGECCKALLFCTVFAVHIEWHKLFYSRNALCDWMCYVWFEFVIELLEKWAKKHAALSENAFSCLTGS